MAINQFFKSNLNHNNQQRLLEDLVIESIRAYGIDCYFMPRTIQTEDELFGEDVISRFEHAVPVEMYVKSVDGFEGEGDLFSKFGLQIRDSATFVVAQRRFKDSIKETLLSETAGLIKLEEDESVVGESDVVLSEDGDGSDYTIDRVRPNEGDLVYFPLNKKLFEIKFVEHEVPFYQLGQLQTFELRCEVFEYTSEQIRTGVEEIDAIEATYTQDISYREEQADTEGFGLDIVLEGDGVTGTIAHEILPEDKDPAANNNYFELEGRKIVDFSEKSPFSTDDDW